MPYLALMAGGADAAAALAGPRVTGGGGFAPGPVPGFDTRSCLPARSVLGPMHSVLGPARSVLGPSGFVIGSRRAVPG